jgi:hypothetical protein
MVFTVRDFPYRDLKSPSLTGKGRGGAEMTAACPGVIVGLLRKKANRFLRKILARNGWRSLMGDVKEDCEPQGSALEVVFANVLRFRPE